MAPSKDRIVVPQRMVAGGFDFKFETDPYDINLRGLLCANDYTDAITTLNEKIKPARATGVDGALLATGPLLVPLALWGVRHGVQTRKRKTLLKKAIHEFNASHPALWMRWNRRPESCLTIEQRPPHLVGAAPPIQAASLDEEDIVVPAESAVVKSDDPLV